MAIRNRDKGNVREGGYIKLFRSLKEWEWYHDTNTTKLWIHILLSVSWTVQKYRGILINNGQMLTSYRRLAEETGLSVQEIRTAINHLKSTHEIRVEPTQQGTLITVENWRLFQGEDGILNTDLFD